MRDLPDNLKKQRYVGVTGLAEAATALLAESGPVQERGTVTEYPDERTVRYYLSEGLISPAQEKQGTASVFGHIHLLQLLVIKRLQAEHIPIRKIREMVSGRTERQLEKLLKGEDNPGSRNEAMRYLEALLAKPTPAPPPASYVMPSQSAPPSPPPRLSQIQIPNTGTWSRVQVEPGLEIHIRDDYQLPVDANAHNRLVTRMLETLKQLVSGPRKKGK